MRLSNLGTLAMSIPEGEQAGARLLFLPPYSPDFYPIEMACFSLGALLRKAATRTVDDLWAILPADIAAPVI
jgi:transposase